MGHGARLGVADAGHVVERDAPGLGVLQLDALHVALHLAHAHRHLARHLALHLILRGRLLHLDRAQPPELGRLVKVVGLAGGRVLGLAQRLRLLLRLRRVSISIYG